MRNSMVFPVGTLVTFLMVLARVAGTFTFVPLPGVKNGLEPARVVLVLAITVALFPLWPKAAAEPPAAGQLAAWMISEAALGVAAGLAVALVTEAFLVAAQVAGMQAGYGYASMLDPNTQADSGVLIVFAQLIAGMLFFAIGFDREILRVMARSLETVPPGSFVVTVPAASAIVHLGGSMIVTGFKLALPVVALLVMIDIALALAGKLNAQLQLVSLMFPAKMLAAVAVLVLIAALFPRVFRQCAGEAFGVLRIVTGA